MAGMAVAAVCATGCGSATLVQDGGAGAGGNGTGGQGGTAGHAPTGTGGNAGAGGKVGTGGGAGGTAGTTGSGGAGGTAASGGAGGTAASGGAGGTAASGGAGGTAASGGAGGTAASGGAGGKAASGGAGGAGGAKTADGNSCSSNLVCQNGNCSTYAVSGASICCPAGNSNCGTCVSEQTDNANCGACGTKCSANRSCQSGGCACQGYTLPSSCGGCGSWGFDSGTAEGWAKDVDPNFPVNGGGTNGATNFIPTTNQHHDGTYALAVPILVDVTTTYLASTAVPLCANGSTIAIGGYTMTAWIKVVDAPGGNTLGALDALFFSAWGPSGAENEPVVFGGSNIDTGNWFQASITFNSATQADHIAIYLTPNEGWQGTMYIDGVTLTGP
jgi:hypothetical protein